MVERLHILGSKNHGKTTLIVDLIRILTRRGLRLGTIKHTGHRHELDAPGKDSHRFRHGGAEWVGVLSPTMTALFHEPPEGDSVQDPYARLLPWFADCDLILVEGDTQTTAAKIEVWRAEMGTPPLASSLTGIRAIVTDDPWDHALPRLLRRDVAGIAQWITDHILERPSRLEPQDEEDQCHGAEEKHGIPRHSHPA